MSSIAGDPITKGFSDGVGSNVRMNTGNTRGHMEVTESGDVLFLDRFCLFVRFVSVLCQCLVFCFDLVGIWFDTAGIGFSAKSLPKEL